MIRKMSICSVLLLMTSACVTIPEPLQVNESVKLTAYASVKETPDRVEGQTARWGGVIAGVSNTPKTTVLEVVHFPLTSSAKPKQQDQTLGRFKVHYPGLLDPMIYQKGRSITAIGQLMPQEMGKIGEHEYLYPVLKADYVHLWKNVQQIDINIWQPAYWHHDRFWNPYRPYHHPPVIIKKSSKVNHSTGQKSTTTKKSKSIR